MCARLRAYELRVTSSELITSSISENHPTGRRRDWAARPPRPLGRLGELAGPGGRRTATRNNTVYTSTLMPRNGERTGPGGLLYAHPRDPGGPRHIPATSLQHHSGARPHQYKTTFALLTLCGAALGTLNLAARTHPATKTLDHALDGKSRRLSRTWWQGMGGETRLACTCAQWQAAHFQR